MPTAAWVKTKCGFRQGIGDRRGPNKQGGCKAVVIFTVRSGWVDLLRGRPAEDHILLTTHTHWGTGVRTRACVARTRWWHEATCILPRASEGLRGRGSVRRAGSGMNMGGDSGSHVWPGARREEGGHVAGLRRCGQHGLHVVQSALLHRMVSESPAARGFGNPWHAKCKCEGLTPPTSYPGERGV